MIRNAIDKIRQEQTDTKGLDHAGRLMSKSVAEKLCSFCEQDEEFAEAVLQGGTFESCMKVVARGVTSGISDEEAYCRAVQFYFPGAKISVSMTIDLVGDAAEPDIPKRGVVLSLMDFL